MVVIGDDLTFPPYYMEGSKMTKETLSEEKAKINKPETEEITSQPTTEPPLTALQNQIGNQAIQRLLAQRSGEGPSEVDDETASRINSARGGGQSLDASMQAQMSQAMGHDFSGVNVHTSSESHALNEQLGAKAFTTGQDVFFREGAYNPDSSDGQELIAHELTHVVQQSTGAVGGGGSKMTVNAPGDSFEQEADSVAKTVTTPEATAGIQRQAEEEEEPLQMQAEEEEEVQMQAEEEEEPVQMQAEEEEQIV